MYVSLSSYGFYTESAWVIYIQSNDCKLINQSIKTNPNNSNLQELSQVADDTCCMFLSNLRDCNYIKNFKKSNSTIVYYMAYGC